MLKMVVNVVLILLCNFVYSSDTGIKSDNITNNSLIGNSEIVPKSFDSVIDSVKKGEDLGKAIKNAAGVETKKKTKFSKKPYFLGIGIDPFTFLYNLLTNLSKSMGAKSNNFLDFRFKIDTGFNRILLGINFGLLRWTTEIVETEIIFKKSTIAFFINPCIYYNFFKKNSSRNALYLGGGINFNGTFYKEVDAYSEESTENTFYDKKFWLWFNLELGNRIRLLRFLHLNAHFRITFLNFNIKSVNDRISVNISNPHILYGYGYYKKSYNVEFCLNFLFNIDLFNDKKVEIRESYLYL